MDQTSLSDAFGDAPGGSDEGEDAAGAGDGKAGDDHEDDYVTDPVTFAPSGRPGTGEVSPTRISERDRMRRNRPIDCKECLITPGAVR